MIYDIVISYQAEIDLRGIFEYIAFELQTPENACGQLDRLEACILSCSIYSGWWYTSGYDYTCYVRWKGCGYAIKKIYKNKIIWKHQSEMVGAFFMPEEICFYAHFYGRRYRPWLTELWVLLSRLTEIPPNYRLASCIIQSVGKIKNYISSTFHKRCVEWY